MGRIRNRRTGNLRKSNPVENDYERASLWDGNAYRRALVHRLVALAFCHRSDGRHEVNHINGDKHDNRAENLEWCTRQENVRDAWERAPWNPPAMAGESNPNAKLTEKEVREIRRLRKQGITLKEVAAKFGVTFGLVSAIARGRAWKHVRN